jgi:hypothetical protein
VRPRGLIPLQLDWVYQVPAALTSEQTKNIYIFEYRGETLYAQHDLGKKIKNFQGASGSIKLNGACVNLLVCCS